jgi:phage FluMu protein Com
MSEQLDGGAAEAPRSDGMFQISSFQIACPSCRTLNSVIIKRSRQSSWNDRTAYFCASCRKPIGARSAFCVETALVAS